MSVIFLLLTISTLMAGIFLLAFIRAVRKGQYDDDRSPAVRILLDDAVGRSVQPGPVPGQPTTARHSAQPRTTHPIANEPS
ncbi:MAG: cbb3-type cytochrome oxidase assembly protein CcoS [Flavobacteriales bacterium]|nr:cbb3-type cytochrome oxidase assembly protein CcoS [Flavobacteriales bacterium]MBP9080576.1 cbb3-type cytochrome oxidase assembly protein CcoS [Flavobacteriales bacterium]